MSSIMSLNTRDETFLGWSSGMIILSGGIARTQSNATSRCTSADTRDGAVRCDLVCSPLPDGVDVRIHRQVLVPSSAIATVLHRSQTRAHTIVVVVICCNSRKIKA